MSTGPRYMIDDPGPFASQQEWVEFEAGLARLDQDDIAVHWAYQMVADFWANEWSPSMVSIRRRIRERRLKEPHGIHRSPTSAYAPAGLEPSVNCQVMRNWSPRATQAIVSTRCGTS